jgi:regulatory protein
MVQVSAVEVSATDLRRAAMDLLARREHSYRELCDKLSQRSDDAGLIRQVIDQLAGEGLQSDARFAEVYLRSRAQRFYGPQRIKTELRERGIDEGIVAAALRTADIDWQGNLEKLVFDKFGLKPTSDFKERAQRMRFLQYRGFAVDAIHRIVANPDLDDA